MNRPVELVGRRWYIFAALLGFQPPVSSSVPLVGDELEGWAEAAADLAAAISERLTALESAQSVHADLLIEWLKDNDLLRDARAVGEDTNRRRLDHYAKQGGRLDLGTVEALMWALDGSLLNLPASVFSDKPPTPWRVRSAKERRGVCAEPQLELREVAA